MSDEELDKIRRQYADRIQRDNVDQQEAVARQNAEQQKMQQDALKQQILRRILTESARTRLANIKLVKPDFAEMVENQLIQLAQSGRITTIDENQLITILRQITEQKRDTNIEFRRS